MSSMLEAAKNTNIDKYFSDLRPTKENPWYGLKAGQKCKHFESEIEYNPCDLHVYRNAGERYKYPTWTRCDMKTLFYDNISNMPLACMIIDKINKGRINDIINNTDYNIRALCAMMGIGLDTLVDDKNSSVREAVAIRGYGLDKLVFDKGYNVLRIAINYGYGWDLLISDEDFQIRRYIAENGYGLNKLINDGDEDVRDAVNRYLKSNGDLTLEQWTEKYPERVVKE